MNAPPAPADAAAEPPQSLALRFAAWLARALSPLLGETRARQSIGYLYGIWILVLYSFQVQHGKALLGLVWALLTPLLFIAVYIPVISAMGGVTGAEAMIGKGKLAYPIYIVTGFLLWVAFNQGIQSGTGSLVEHSDVVHHSPVPLAILPLVKVLNAIVGFALAALVMVICLALLGRFPGIRLVLLPLLLILATLFTLGLALLCSSLAVLFRDVVQIVTTLMMIEFFACPLLYLPSAIPAGPVRWLVEANPLTPFITLTHAAFIRQYPFTWGDLGLCVMWTGIALVAGVYVFGRLEPVLPEHT